MISHHHRTVFVHIPKCGGQSIEAAFLADLGLNWNLRAPLLLRPNDQPELGPPRLAHLIARDYVARKWLPQELFESYFTFAVVRSPFSRVLSAYNYLKRPESLSHFVQQDLASAFKSGDPYAGLYFFMRPQADFLTDHSGDLMLDNIYRLENLSTAIGEIREKSGLKAEIPHANRSARRADLADLGPDDIAAIRELYAADFTLLGYPDDL